MADEDQDQKTEQPTQKRLDEALEKGNVPFSREVGSFLMLGTLAITVSWFLPDIFKNTYILLLPFIANADQLATDQAGIGQLLWRAAWGGLGVIALPLVACIVVAFAASFLQNGIIISTEPIMPKLEKISPLAGLKRMFSMRSLVEFLKSLVKIIVVGVVAFVAIYPELSHIKQLPNSTTEAMLIYLSMLALRMIIGIVIAMFFIAIFDLIFQRFQYAKSLRMSRQEIKDEYKQSEGDPIIKQRLRQLRQERARKRMMAAVPEADVVITNPTHFAVALKYDTATMKAPTVVAKGQDLIALKIREVAEENKVPIVQNPPLAQALFSSTDIDEEIPLTHYEAVAKVISYVYQLKGKIPPAARRQHAQ
jgi:flagellar biosynthetic protein FlhB